MRGGAIGYLQQLTCREMDQNLNSADLQKTGCPEDTDRMANSVDPVQTAPSGSDCTFRSPILVFTICPHLSIQKLRIIFSILR